MRTSLLLLPVILAGCDTTAPDTVLLTVVNETGVSLWYFDYAACGSDEWIAVLDGDEPEPRRLSTEPLAPGCYQLSIQNERGCDAQTDTGGRLSAGAEFVWTVGVRDVECSATP
jgi:hypothetical protein